LLRDFGRDMSYSVMDALKTTRILIIGGKDKAFCARGLPLQVERIGSSIPDLLAAPLLVDFDAVILWPDEDFLAVGDQRLWEKLGLKTLPKQFWSFISNDETQREGKGRSGIIDWSGKKEYRAKSFVDREAELLRNCKSRHDAVALLNVLQVRAVERLHELILGANKGGQINVLVVDRDASEYQLAWINPLLGLKDRVGMKTDFVLPPLSPEHVWVNKLRRLLVDSIREWPIEITLKKRSYDVGDFYIEDTPAKLYPKEFKEHDWLESLSLYENWDPSEWDGVSESDNYLFNEEYGFRTGILGSRYSVLKVVVDGKGDALALALPTGDGCLLVVPPPVSIDALVDALCRNDDQSSSSSSHAQEFHPWKELQAELGSIRILEDIKPARRGRHIKVNDITKLQYALVNALNRRDVCISLGKDDYDPGTISTIRRKLNNEWQKDSLREFARIAIAILDLLPAPSRKSSRAPK